MAGIELTPSRPPRAFPLTTDAEMIEAFTELVTPIAGGGYGLLGSVRAVVDTRGQRVLQIDVNLDGQPPAAMATVGEGKSIVVEVSGVFALTDEQIAERYGS